MQQFSSTQHVVGVLRPDHGDERSFAAGVSRLERHYQPLHQRPVSIMSRWVPGAGVGLVVVDALGRGVAPPTLEDLVTWGAPSAAASAVAAAVEAPDDSARNLPGVWMLCGVSQDRVRLVTSPTLVHTLKRVNGRSGIAFATRGWAGHVLADAPPTLNEPAIAEFVLFDYTFGSDELLTGTEMLDDAHVVDFTRRGVDVRSWWSRSERFAPGRPTTPAGLRRTLAETMRPVAATPHVALGLTAGRDSSLLASAIADNQQRIPTFTFGRRWFEDPRGARAIASSLGWPHAVVTAKERARAWPRIAALSRWSEGMQTGADLVDTDFNWDVDDLVWLAGTGGEIGRAFYWSGSGNPLVAAQKLRTFLTAALPASTATSTIARFDEDLGRCDGYGRPKEDSLDLFYATGRMAKWVARLLPARQIAHVHPGYLDPLTVRALLDIPLGDRATGATFRDAAESDHPPLPAVAAGSLSRARPLAQFEAARFALLDRARTRSLLRLVDGIPATSAVRRQLGERWWQATRTRAATRTGGSARRQLWNAIAVEGLARAIDGTDTFTLRAGASDC